VFVARSVDRRRGATLGLLTAIGGSAIALTPLLASRLISAAGWRWAWVVLAIIVVVVGNIAAIVVGRLDRAASPMAAESSVDHRERTVADGTTWAMRRNGFVLVATAFTCNGVVATALAFHQIAILGERGLDSAAAAANFLPQSLAAALVALAVGRAVDRLTGRWVLVASMSLLTIATLSVTRVDGGLAAVSFGMLLGSATAATASSEGALLARWLGVDRLGTLRGRMMTIVVIGTALAPLGFELLATATGSFTAAARLLAILPAGVAVMASLIRLPTEVVGEAAKMV
jgi:MFS family permease